MANKTENRYVNVYITAGDAQKNLDLLVAKQKKLNDELVKTADPKRIQNLNKELARLAEPIDRATKKLKGELSPSVRDVQTQVNNLGNRLKHMSTEDADFSKVIKQYGEAKVLLGQLKAGTDQLGSAQKSLKKEAFLGSFFGTAAGGFALAAAGKIKDFFKEAFSEAAEAEEKTARLKATLDNLGRSDAFDRIVDKSNQLAQQFRFLDNEDIQGVFEKLINFGKLTEKQMNEVLPVIIDFAAKQRISIEDSASVIIKALAGQGKGLREYGINIKDAKSETERFNIVVGVLGEKVKGAGEDFQNTAAGGVAETKQQFKELKEEIGTGLLPMINRLLRVTLDMLDKIKSFSNAVKAELSGKSGFIQIAVDEVNNNPVLQQAVHDQADQFVKQVTNLKKLIEESPSFKALGKIKLDLANPEDNKLLEETQKKVIDNINKQLAAEQKRLEVLKETGGRQEQLEARSLEISIRARTEALHQINEILNPKKETLGINQGGDGGGGGDKIDKIAEDKKKLLEELEKTEVSMLSGLDKAIGELILRYSKMIDLAHGDKVLLLRIEQDFQKEKLKIINEFAAAEIAAWQKAGEQTIKEQDERFKKTLEALKKMSEDIRKASDEAAKTSNEARDRNRLAGLQLDFSNSTGRERLEAQLKLLKEQERQALDNDKLTANERLVIQDDFNKKRKEAELNYWVGVVELTLNYAQQIYNIAKVFADAKTDKENAELEADRNRNEQKKKNLDRRLKGGLISQQQYNRELDKMDRELERKEHDVRVRQFKRQQKFDIAQAAINGALGVTKTIAENGLPAAIPFLIAEAILLAAQIVTISGKKPPEFGGGGKLRGPSHRDASSGMPVVDPLTGLVQAFLEGGEGVTNKKTMADTGRYTVEGTPSQIISWLNARHGGVHWESGARLVPAWKNMKQMPMNVPALRYYYALGGVFGKQPSQSNQSSEDSSKLLLTIVALIQQQQSINADTAAVLSDLQSTLSRIQNEGIPAYTLLTQFEKQQARKNAIVADATVKA